MPALALNPAPRRAIARLALIFAIVVTALALALSAAPGGTPLVPSAHASTTHAAKKHKKKHHHKKKHKKKKHPRGHCFYQGGPAPQSVCDMLQHQNEQENGVGG
jgi:hypothetical protein